MKKIITIIGLLSLGYFAAHADKTIYVNTTIQGNGDGTSAANACKLGTAITTKYDATAGAVTTIVFPANTTFTLVDADGSANASRFDFPATSNKFIFQGNNATLDGTNAGKRIFRISGTTANIEINDLKFINGKLAGDYAAGGGIYFAGETLKINNCTFTGCSSKVGGALASRGKDVQIRDSYFFNNYLTANGGNRGAAITHTGTTSGGTLLVENTTFNNNSGVTGLTCLGTAISTSKDFAVSNFLSSIKINNCTFYKNLNGLNSTYGSAAVYLDDLSGTNTSIVELINNTFYANNNAALNIIGIKQTVALVNNVIIGDSYATINVLNYQDHGVIAGSTIAAGRPAIVGKNNYIVAKNPIGSTNITESSFQSGSNGNTFVTTISQSVIDAVYLNSTLSATSIPYLTITNSASPLVNTGTNSVSGVTIPATDMRGISRGSSNTGSVYDLGAFELSTPTFNSTQSLSTSGISSTELAGAIMSISSGEFTLDQSISVNSIQVQPGAKLTLNSGSAISSGKIFLQSNSTGTATFVDENSGVSSVSGNVQQYLPSARNWYVASPISTATVPSSSTYFGYQESGDNSDLSVSGATAYWKPYITGSSLTAGKGYIAQPTGESTLTFDGTLTTGSTTVQLSRTTLASKPGFNLVGNPYPSYLDWSLVAAANTNVLPTAWFRTKKTTEAGGGYTFATVNVENETPIVVSNDANTTVTNLIPPMQAYWVRLTENSLTTDYTVTNNMRAHKDDTGNKLKAPKDNNMQLIRLRVSNGTNSDEAVIYFKADASDSYDRYDSPKMFNNSASIPEIYTLAGTEKLVINGMSELKTDIEIPLGFVTGENKTHTLLVKELKNINTNINIALIDKQKNTVTELSESTNYSFSADVTPASTDRFSLLFRMPSVSTEIENAVNTTVYSYVNAANQIAIVAPEKSDYAIYNAVGQLMEKGFLTSNSQTSNIKLAVGMYVVRVNNQTTRVIVK